MIIAMATDDKQTVSAVFGRAGYFALYKDGQNQPEFIVGSASAEHGAGTGAVSRLAELGVNMVYAAELGPKAKDSLAAAKISVTIVPAGSPLAQALKRA